VKRVELPAKEVPTVEVAQERLVACQRELDAVERSGAPAGEVRRFVTKAQGAAAELARADGAGLTASPVRLTAARLAGIALLAVSAEVSSAIGAAIEAGSPFSETIVVGLGGDYCGYIVDGSDHDAGTYESLTSPFDPTADGVLAGAAVELLASLA
jgi:hypothetical protein